MFLSTLKQLALYKPFRGTPPNLIAISLVVAGRGEGNKQFRGERAGELLLNRPDCTPPDSIPPDSIPPDSIPLDCIPLGTRDLYTRIPA